MNNPIDAAHAAYGDELPRRNRAEVVLRTGVKRCSACKQWLWVAAYPVDAGRADGFNNKCRACIAAYARAWHARPANVGKQATYSRRVREKDPARDAEKRLADRCRGYGITVARYQQMLAGQGGGCAMCGKTPEQSRRSLAVDHDHSCCPTKMKSCGKCVRGLLCWSCNMVLGFIENAAWQAACRAYLDRAG